MVGRKFIVTINVVQAMGLKSKSGGNLSKMAPFFQYEFYTFDEYYSKNGSGPDPRFGEVNSYNLPITDATLNYLENKKLQINIVDDNANLGGFGKGGQAAGDDTELDDLIGTCEIPLKKIAQA